MCDILKFKRPRHYSSDWSDFEEVFCLGLKVASLTG